jgi:hypothetical protein
MNLDETQRKKVAEWIAAGMKLSDIQNRLASELGVGMTYMEVRLLVDDLKLTPKDIERPKPPVSALDADNSNAPTAARNQPAPPGLSGAPASPGGVSVKLDTLARPGAVVSGKVTFSDGKLAEWYFDQTGRLGLVPQETGYRPPPADLQQFQALLDVGLSKMGF